jgi:hypothetical protein
MLCKSIYTGSNPVSTSKKDLWKFGFHGSFSYLYKVKLKRLKMQEYQVKVYDYKTEWYQNGERHRLDGPAVEYASGYKEWYQNGELHRLDGPAVEYADGSKAWFIENECLTESEFNARINPVELTLDEIALKFNIPVSQLKIKK